MRTAVRLAAVSEKLLAIYAEDGMSLEQLMAFTVTTDHARQEQVWDAIQKSWSKDPYQIRRMLTERAIPTSDRRAVFIGLDAYEAAGGVITRDLFAEDDGGWLETAGLLDRLVTEKLKAEAETIATEGWKWVEAAINLPYGHDHHLRRLDGTPLDLTAEEKATIVALHAEHKRLADEYADAPELPDEVDQRIGEIETALVKFRHRRVRFEPADIARAGAFVSIDEDGGLRVDRGYVRPEDEAAAGEPEDGVPAPAETDGADQSTPGRARGAPCRHHRRRRSLARGRRGRRHRAIARAVADRVDRASDARAARCGGE
jgi:ParB family chromosome partitioning protein